MNARARDLTYALYRRPLHPELLPIAKHDALVRDSFRAAVHALDPAGHAIAFSIGAARGPVLVEVVATPATELPRAGRIELRPIARVRDRVKARGDLIYECTWALETCSAQEFSRRHQKVLAAAPQGTRLLHERRRPEEEGPAAFTAIDFVAKERSLEAFVVHAFPRERTFVFLQSSFGVAP